MAAPMAEWLVGMLVSSQVVDWVDRMVVTLVGRSVARSVALIRLKSRPTQWLPSRLSGWLLAGPKLGLSCRFYGWPKRWLR